MSSAKNYWQRQKRMLWRLPLVVLGIGLLFPLLRSAGDVAHWLSTTWPTSSSSERLQILNFAVTSGLTSVLIIITGVYAWLTWRMVLESVETRRRSIRPTLVMELGELAFQKPENEAYMTLTCTFRVANYGVGPAIFPRGNIAMPYSRPTEKESWPHDEVSTSVEGLPPMLHPGDGVNSKIRISAEVYEIPNGRTLEFARVEFRFEDSDRNLFQQTQTFNLFKRDHCLYWILMYDALLMIPFRKRSYVTDGSITIGIDTKNAEHIYERVGHF